MTICKIFYLLIILLLVANNLWNSIMQPFGSKSRNGSATFSRLNCPTVEHPFIFTRRNSG